MAPVGPTVLMSFTRTRWLNKLRSARPTKAKGHEGPMAPIGPTVLMMMMMTRRSRKVLQQKASPQTEETHTSFRKYQADPGCIQVKTTVYIVGISSPGHAG